MREDSVAKRIRTRPEKRGEQQRGRQADPRTQLLNLSV
jgi:hypothetical protein